VLRLPVTGDADTVLAMMRDPATIRWNPAPGVVDVPSAAAWCVRSADWSDGDHATFAIADRATDAFLGVVSVHQVDRVQATAEVGYRVAPAARGRGVAAEAVDAAAAWAYPAMSLFRLEIAHAVVNPASCGVATRAGFVLEGTLRQAYVYGDGHRYDDHLHARLATDPRPVLPQRSGRPW
jgi:RimJ/RimL family protein N-acetyltransferase